MEPEVFSDAEPFLAMRNPYTSNDPEIVTAKFDERVMEVLESPLLRQPQAPSS